MGLTSVNQLGEWNPQLVRELKGQLKRRNISLIVGSSLLSQFLIFVACSNQICINYVGSACVQFEWYTHWEVAFRILNWLLPLLLLFCGAYLLIADLGKEEHRGTLNFIRLSPQSSQNILLGKMFGVPSLLYLGIVLALPLHAGSALVSGVSWIWLSGVYTLWGAGCCLCYSTAVLITLLNRSKGGVQAQAWAGSFLCGFFGLLFIGFINFSLNWYQLGHELGNWQWFLLPFGRQPGFAYIWMLITVSVGTYWIWQAANRLFRSPSNTLVSKLQSYWLVGSFQLWLLGFALPELNSVASTSSNLQFSIGCFFLFVLTPGGFVVLSAALSPNRQTLQDWARYRRKSSSSSKGILNRSLMQDLIWGEKSPALVAIAINLLITAAIWVPWALLWSGKDLQGTFKTPELLLGLLLTVNLILIYATIAEIMLFMKPSQRALWASGTLGAVFVLLVVSQGVLKIEPLKIPFLWFFSPLPAVALVNASATTIFLGVLAQLSVLGLLTLQLTRQLHKAGESTSKAFFAKHLSLPPSNFN